MVSTTSSPAIAAATTAGHVDVDVATLPTETLMDLAAGSARRMSCEAGFFTRYTGELGKREGWRTEGATSLEAWIVERCGVSPPPPVPLPTWPSGSRICLNWPLAWWRVS